MPADTSKPTQQIVGNYDVLDKIADGGMGSVYKGRHRETNQIVAIKIVAPHMEGNQVLLKRFEQEYNAARQLDHPNIVKALEFGTTGSTPYLVMEFVDGETLGQKVAREGAMPEKEAVKLIAQVAQALHRAHKEKLIHRDVKPDNILVTPDGVAKLVDLGLVKELETDLNLTRTGRGLGTPHFMAPEQFKNAKNADLRCDIYSLGATLYMMVTGEMPFQSSGPLEAYMKKIENKLSPPRQLVPGLSERIDWAILRAMSADPDNRPASCREFVEDLTGRSTRKVQTLDSTASGQQEIWYLVYKDEDDVAHTVKGTKAGICRSLKEGLLGDASNVRAGRSKNGPFEPLRNFPEYRHLVIEVGGGAPAAPTNAPAPAPAPARNAKAPTPSPADKPTEAATPRAPKRRKLPHISLEGVKAKGLHIPVWAQFVGLALLVGMGALLGLYFFR